MKAKLLSVPFFLLVAAVVASAQSPQAQKPSLVAESGHSVSATRGGTAQSFQITSAILNETRRILIVFAAFLLAKRAGTPLSGNGRN